MELSAISCILASATSPFSTHCAAGFVCATRSCLDAGGCPAAGYFILLAQNTSNQTKGHPAAPALRATFGLTGKLGGCATRPDSLHKTQAAAELEQCSPSSQFARQTEAAQKGFLGFVGGARVWVPSPLGRAGWGGFVVLYGPLGPPPSSTAGPGEVGEDCLRPRGPSSAAARFGEQHREPVA